jgi:predicted nucleic acid-binding protein
MPVVVADSTPLNYLAALGDFELLNALYKRIIIPPAVYSEVVSNATAYPVHAAVTNALGKWIEISAPPAAMRVLSLMRSHNLEQGEVEAIAIASELELPLLVDEQDAVVLARSSGITVVRTPMIYARAKLEGLILSVREKLDQLRSCGFWLKPEHYDSILSAIGEA